MRHSKAFPSGLVSGVAAAALVGTMIAYRSWIATHVFRRDRNVVISLDLTRLADRLGELTDDDGEYLDAAIRPEIEAATDAAADQLVAGILRDPIAAAGDTRQFRSGFEHRLLKGWDPAIALFECIHQLATEFGSQLNAHCGSRAADDEDLVFETLARLHGRACLTTSEVGALLRSGHATGGNARWRTLHELTIVAFFISEHGDDLARRYLEHQGIEAHQAALQYQEFEVPRGAEPFDSTTLAEMRSDHDELLRRYGTNFGGRYGWAAEVLGKKSPTFSDIETAVGLSSWKSTIRMANHGVHAGPRGAFWDIGMHPDLDAIPAGPSHFGLADAASNTLAALAQITVLFLAHSIKSDLMDEADSAETIVRQLMTLVQLKALLPLVDAASEMLVTVQKELESVPPHIRPAPSLWDPSYED